MGWRRDWHRVVHSEHVYGAENVSSAGEKCVGVCTEITSAGQVKTRAFHLGSGRAVSGIQEKIAKSSMRIAALRAYFASLA